MKRFLSIVLLMSTINLIAQDINSNEKHFGSIRQLTFGADNAEAYFSSDGNFIVFQSNNLKWNNGCDQIYMLDIADASAVPQLISSGKGRTTCAYFVDNNENILYASTQNKIDSCPVVRKVKGKYLWEIYPQYEIFKANRKGEILQQLTDNQYYDAEATVSPDGSKIVFTSDRSGDIELWTMNVDGSEPKQITKALGYDGGAFFSPNGKYLIFRASRPKTIEEVKEYKTLLKEHLVAPTKMELYICKTDGTELQAITKLGNANWAPFFHPSGNKVIFSSNYQAANGFNFQLYMFDLKTKNLEQITYESQFNAFPMFSPDGSKLIFSSNRTLHGEDTKSRDTNIFIADWIE